MSFLSNMAIAGAGAIALGTGFAFAAAPAAGLGANLSTGFANACLAGGHALDTAGTCASFVGETVVDWTL